MLLSFMKLNQNYRVTDFKLRLFLMPLRTATLMVVV